jgi:A-factor biosynthesis hotdog domain
MKSRTFFIVGDKFESFAQGKDVLTVHQLRALSHLPKHLLEGHNVLLLGQGAAEEDVAAIARGYNSNFDSSSRFDVSDLTRDRELASAKVSHKRFAHNTLISAPRRMSSDTFELDLIIDERCELMGDHQTGQHVQGMIIVEAFRQSFLAVTDTFFPFGDGERYFVINAMHVDFQNFLFPLPAHIHYRIEEADVNDRRARYKTVLAAVQNGETCTTANISFTVYPQEVIAGKEAALASKVTSKLLESRAAARLGFHNHVKPTGDASAEREA